MSSAVPREEGNLCARREGADGDGGAWEAPGLEEVKCGGQNGIYVERCLPSRG